MASIEDLSVETTHCNRDDLKLWLCELTHLTPPQVERLIEKMEEGQGEKMTVS
ncbi:MAG: hypothetical protein WCD18_01055 [Thermosynechococcaceae cyanobacterium]